MKRLLAYLLTLLFVLVVPGLVHADVALVQDSCEGRIDANGNYIIDATFTIVNFSLPAAICDLTFIPEPLPPDPGCEVVMCSHPPGWACFLSPLGGADWFALTPADCIPPGTSKGGFDVTFFRSVVQPPDFCCYIVQFSDATGAIMWEQEECFCTEPVPNKPLTWGLLKSLYD